VSTGIFGFDNEAAAHVALRTTREWLEFSPAHARHMQAIVFVVFLPVDLAIYRRLLPAYFPRDEAEQQQSAAVVAAAVQSKPVQMSKFGGARGFSLGSISSASAKGKLGAKSQSMAAAPGATKAAAASATAGGPAASAATVGAHGEEEEDDGVVDSDEVTDSEMDSAAEEHGEVGADLEARSS